MTLVGEKGRKILREVLKGSQSSSTLKSRQIPPEIVSKYRSKISSFQEELKEILKQEEEEKLVR